MYRGIRVSIQILPRTLTFVDSATFISSPGRLEIKEVKVDVYARLHTGRNQHSKMLFIGISE